MSAAQTILVIDDDIKFSRGLTAILKRAGYQVSTVHNGVDGLAAVHNLKPDIILCDIMMPPPNGFQLKKELEKDPETDRIPFLFLTARTAPVDKTVGLKKGADDYITKPFDVNELLARIQSVLRRDEMGRLRGVKETAAALDQLRTSISTNISHELRTPLTVLISTLDLVIRDKFTESNKELFNYIKMAGNSAQRLKFLIEDLEMLTAIDQGELDTIRQPISLGVDVNGTIDLVLKDWEDKELDLHLDIDPGTVIYAPRNGFIHTISHLVQNACKFSLQKSEINISVRENGVGGGHL
jgi:DNA-binding response OmpR family regulator